MLGRKGRKTRAVTVYVVSFAVAISIMTDYAARSQATPAAPAMAASTSNGAPPAASNSPLDAYQSYVSIVERAAQAPSAHDWSADFATVSLDPLKERGITAWRYSLDHQVVDLGPTTHSPRVVTTVGAVAQITDCVDTSQVRSTRYGRPESLPAGNSSRFKASAMARLVSSRWVLVDLSNYREQTC